MIASPPSCLRGEPRACLARHVPPNGGRSRLIEKRDDHVRHLAELRARLAAAIMHDADPAAIDGIVGDIARSQAAFQRDVVDHVLAVRAVLRPDQRPAFEDVIATQLRAGSALPGQGATEAGR